MNKEQLADRLLATFLAELEDQLRLLNEEVLALEARPTETQHLKVVFRVAHTLKGAARAAGVAPVEQFCHILEGMLAEARDGKRTLGPDDFALLFASADALSDAGRRLKAGEALPGSQLVALSERLKRGERDEAIAPAVRVQADAPPLPAASSRQPIRAVPAAAAERGGGQIRVEAESLDVLLAASGQLVIAARQAGSRPADVASLHDQLARTSAEWSRISRRMREALRTTASAPTLVQAVDDVAEGLRRVLHDAGRVAARVRDDAQAMTRATDDVADQVRRLRLRPFAEACEALPRAVRDLATETGKVIDLEVQGTEVRVDRAVSDGLREALLHLVRNAADHGIEAPAEREPRGKPPRGKILLTATQSGERLRVTVSDDGGGLDLPRLRARLAERAIDVPGDDDELVRLLFAGGLSSRGEVTTISGRGVGLELVRAAMERIRGAVRVRWTPGAGTTFTIECPPSLATLRVLLVSIGSQTFGIPTTAVERLVRVRALEISRVEGRDAVKGREGLVPLVPLAALLPPLAARQPGPWVVVVHLKAGEQRLAVAVDELLSEEELVLRPLARGAEGLPHLSGAAILGTARVALVLDPASLVAAGLGAGASPGIAFAEGKPAEAVRRRILVVDDSITTRTLEQSILEAAGFEVVTAVDGADGWRVLQERGADLVVADVEMPRMDGFGLCEAIRGSQRFAKLPVVLVTALESAEHRARGLEAGADAYLGKSSFDQQSLLDAIAQLLG
jgi:two-component system chemotaxis sensor kinase CheA